MSLLQFYQGLPSVEQLSSILIVSIHSFSKITPYIHKAKEAPDLSATYGLRHETKTQTPSGPLHGHLFSGTTSDNVVELC
jgi:hypothetical protein